MIGRLRHRLAKPLAWYLAPPWSMWGPTLAEQAVTMFHAPTAVEPTHGHRRVTITNVDPFAGVITAREP